MTAHARSVIPALALVLFVSGCGGTYRSGEFTRDYRQALQDHPGVPAQPGWVAHFTETYGNFTGEHLGDRLRELYARDLFFNDTLKTLTRRAELVHYLEQTSQRLSAMSLEILDTRRAGRDVYLRWIMHTEFSPGFRTVSADTIGMTHLRFNTNGKVVLHQDFWDSRQGVFEHIPVLGGMIRWIRSGL